MVAVRSERYPFLRVCDVNVKFVDGVAEVADVDVLERLRALASMGVVVPARQEPVRKKKSE